MLFTRDWQMDVEKGNGVLTQQTLISGYFNLYGVHYIKTLHNLICQSAVG